MDSVKAITGRWTDELKGLSSEIIACLEGSSSLENLNLSKTSEKLLDLRGFAVQKKTLVYGSKGKIKIPEGLTIKNKTFHKSDFSRADFKNCSFHNCKFTNSKFDKTKFNESFFWNCSFSDCQFDGTTFNYCTFNKWFTLFRKITFNFKDNTFRNVSFLETHFHKQILSNCTFIDNNLKAAILTKCELDNITFQGQVTDLFVRENKRAHAVRFNDSLPKDINFFKTNADNFIFGT